MGKCNGDTISKPKIRAKMRTKQAEGDKRLKPHALVYRDGPGMKKKKK